MVCERVLIINKGEIVAGRYPRKTWPIAFPAGTRLLVRVAGPEDRVREALAGVEGSRTLKEQGSAEPGTCDFLVEAGGGDGYQKADLLRHEQRRVSNPHVKTGRPDPGRDLFTDYHRGKRGFLRYKGMEKAYAVYAGPDGEIGIDEERLALGASGDQWAELTMDSLVPLPPEADLFLLPGRRPAGLNRQSGRHELLPGGGTDGGGGRRPSRLYPALFTGLPAVAFRAAPAALRLHGCGGGQWPAFYCSAKDGRGAGRVAVADQGNKENPGFGQEKTGSPPGKPDPEATGPLHPGL